MADETEFTDEEVTYLEEHYPEHAKVVRWRMARHPGWATTDSSSDWLMADGKPFHRLYIEALTVRSIMRIKDQLGQEWVDQTLQEFEQDCMSR
jgi:hypothetical protein